MSSKRNEWVKETLYESDIKLTSTRGLRTILEKRHWVVVVVVVPDPLINAYGTDYHCVSCFGQPLLRWFRKAHHLSWEGLLITSPIINFFINFACLTLTYSNYPTLIHSSLTFLLLLLFLTLFRLLQGNKLLC